jgi:hypothetical protein
MAALDEVAGLEKELAANPVFRAAKGGDRAVYAAYARCSAYGWGPERTWSCVGGRTLIVVFPGHTMRCVLLSGRQPYSVLAVRKCKSLGQAMIDSTRGAGGQRTLHDTFPLKCVSVLVRDVFLCHRRQAALEARANELRVAMRGSQLEKFR